MTATTQFVAVARQNLRNPIVYGLGSTAEQARADATSHADDMSEVETFPCTVALRDAIELGAVDCEIVDGVATVRGE